MIMSLIPVVAGPLVAELQLLRSQLAASAASRTALASKLQARANEVATLQGQLRAQASCATAWRHHGMSACSLALLPMSFSHFAHPTLLLYLCIAALTA